MIDHKDEPVLVKIVDDYGLPQRDTPEGDLVITTQAWIALIMIVAGLGNMFGIW